MSVLTQNATCVVCKRLWESNTSKIILKEAVEKKYEWKDKLL